jgi:hypothetical protein
VAIARVCDRRVRYGVRWPDQQARSAGIAVAIDIALEVEDRERAIAYVCISFASSLLLTLSSAGVRLVVTSY